MDLRKRLARLDESTRKPAGPEPVRPGPAAVRGGAAPDGELQRLLVDGLGLQPTATPTGTLWVRESRRDGLVRPTGPIPDFAGILPAGTPDDLAWDDILFLDTETTGLAGGTGTLPFLLGLAWWENDAFVVRQFFLAGPGQEEPLLDALADLAARFRVVATYNGASFDLPLVRTRARLNRRDDPCGQLVSWDLLVAARRLWGRQLENCRQQTIEAHLTGEVRQAGDIDGALIPATYIEFVRDGVLGLLPEVLRHNRRDMDGMAHILTAAAAQAHALVSGPADWDGPWREAWCLALVGERRRENGPAAAWAKRLASERAELELPAILDAVRLMKRIGAWEVVEELVRRGLAAWPDQSRLHYEAAVLYEHRLVDLERAHGHAVALGDPRRLERLERRRDRT